MHIYSAQMNRVELRLVRKPLEALAAPAVAGLGTFAETSSLARAGRAFFQLEPVRRGRRLQPPSGPPPAVFREDESGLVRTVYREIVVRFKAGLSSRTRRQILARHGFEVRRVNVFVPDQVVVGHAAGRRVGADLLDVANDWAELDDVVFATPNFVSEYRRLARPPIPPAEWHLRNLAREAGQKKGEDVDAPGAWRLTRGKRSVVIAVLDDGVDVEHPRLRTRIWRNPVRSARDQVGRDFFLPDDHPDHYNPRPKIFHYPFSQHEGNDNHGTPCAGVAAAAGRGAVGIAPGCRILAVKIFHADDLASDERVADAIRYAATRADVLSCSWAGGTSPDVQLALADVGLARGGRGVPVFCASGNESAASVGFPASDSNAIAVGASTDQGRHADYSNRGRKLDFVAPSDGGKVGIFTTDVSYANRGYNVGEEEEGGASGLYTDSFGGTSSATPLAAGIAALVLSVNPRLDREEVRQILRRTADKIGRGYDRKGHSRSYGYGRLNAARAVREARGER
jgi:subtilisin family serine protease